MPWAFVVALVLVSLDLRAPFVAVAPISGELHRDLGVGGAAVGTLTSLPGVGYAFAAVGPTVLGATHDATGAWTVPVLIVLGTTAAFSVLGVSAALTQARHHPPV